jgi:predicted MPP superfamily phosphohydrolase
MNISRRKALKYLSAGSLLGLGLWPGCAHKPKESGSFRFLAINDMHYLSAACGDYLSGVVKQMKSHEGVEFCLLVGDSTDAGKREDFGVVRDIFKGLGKPIYTQIGNHDYISQTNRSGYEEIFGKEINYFFKANGWQFLGLDSTDGLRFENTKVPSSTLSWVRDTLPKLDKQAPLVIFTHFPMGTGVKYRPANAEEFLNLFLDYDLKAVLSGHFHGFTEKQIGHTTLTTNRCCSLKRNNHDNTKEKGYFLCSASPAGLTRTFVEYKPAS